MIAFLLPDSDYDPTESGVIWQTLTENNIAVQFVTPTGEVALADPRMTDMGFGILSPLLMSKNTDLECYNKMTESEQFRKPIAYENLVINEISGLFVPGGHAKGMRSLLGSNVAQDIIVKAFNRDLPIGCVCHGTLLLARSIDPKTNRSVLYGRQVTGLLKNMELSAWLLTWIWLRNYYRTYDVSVETEVKRFLKSNDDFQRGPTFAQRDSPESLEKGFTVRDRNLISARWPGDCHRLARDFLDLIRE